MNGWREGSRHHLASKGCERRGVSSIIRRSKRTSKTWVEEAADASVTLLLLRVESDWNELNSAPPSLSPRLPTPSAAASAAPGGRGGLFKYLLQLRERTCMKLLNDEIEKMHQIC